MRILNLKFASQIHHFGWCIWISFQRCRKKVTKMPRSSHTKDQKMKTCFKNLEELFFTNMPEGQFLPCWSHFGLHFHVIDYWVERPSYLLVLSPMGPKPNFKYECWQDPTSCRHPSPCASSVKPFSPGQSQVEWNFCIPSFLKLSLTKCLTETLRWRCRNGYWGSYKFYFLKASSKLFSYDASFSGWSWFVGK